MDQTGIETLNAVLKNGKQGPGRHLVTHGANSLVRAYYGGFVDRRTTLGIQIAEWENAYASHKGYDDLASCPIVLQEKIRLAIGNRLFQMLWSPSPDGKSGARDLRSSENTLNRILTELGLEPEQKDALTLEHYVDTKYGGAQ